MRGFPSRKDQIIFAAIEIISESGLQGLSTKNLAAKQGISESLLYKHFTSIDHVLVAVVDYFSQFDQVIINTVLNNGSPCDEKILTYIKSYLEFYESYPELAAVLLNYEMLLNYQFTRERVQTILANRAGFFIKVIERGQAQGDIASYYSVQELTDLISGLIWATILRWKIAGYGYPIKDNLLQVVKKLLDT